MRFLLIKFEFAKGKQSDFEVIESAISMTMPPMNTFSEVQQAPDILVTGPDGHYEMNLNYYAPAW